ncbi:MAG TPA: hypothetical protein VIS74_01475 [Chthoniobacterales bacterium]
MKRSRFFLPLFAAGALLLGGCASTEFTPWQGTAIEQGTGGTRKAVNGIDVWQYGTPPLRYQILGLIEDKRDPDELFGDRLDDVTKKAREAGANGVILLDSSRRQTGSYTTPSTTEIKVKNRDTVTATTTPGFTTVNYEDTVRFQAVKYLP